MSATPASTAAGGLSPAEPDPGGAPGADPWPDADPGLDADLGPAGEPMLPGMPERLVAATPTRLRGWVSCPRRYRFTYLDRPPPRRGAPWARTAVGAAVHAALARWWREPAQTRTPATAAALLATAWVGQGFRDAAQEYAARERSMDMVSRYAGTQAGARPVGVELTVGVRTRVLALSGRIDRLDERAVPTPAASGHLAGVPGPVRGEPGRDGGPPTTELVVVDYKTGRNLPEPQDARESLALAVYASGAARILRRVCRRVELHHLPSGRVVTHEHTGQSLARTLDRADAIGVELREVSARWARGLSGKTVDQVFPPRPGPGCAWCDFRISCPAGAAASVRLPPWAGIDDDADDAADRPDQPSQGPPAR